MKSMVKKFTATVVAGVLTLSLCAGCGGEKKPVLKIFNWGDFIAEGVIEDFEAEYNCKVIYDEYDSNENMLTKVRNRGSDNYDVVFPSDYAVDMMIQEDLLHELNYDNIPNAANIDPKFKNQAHDPENAYSIPYMTGVIAILYNKEMVQEPVDSMAIMFDDKYAGKVFMLNGMRDTMGMTLKYLGYSMNTDNPAEVEEAKALLLEQKPNVLAYITDEVKDKMMVGEGALALVFSGEGAKAANADERLALAVPKEGTNLAIDNMVILKSSQNIELAEQFLDFMCREDIALRNAEETGYMSPNMAAVELLPDEIKNNPNNYPAFENEEVFLSFSEEQNKLWSDAWVEIFSK